MKEKKPILYLIVPCYNEEEVLPITSVEFYDKMRSLIDRELISTESRILFVNDGSTDNTWNIIKKLSESDPIYIGISQSRNRGHQNALWAGMMESKDCCDITITIDCDGQDDINAIEGMVEEYKKGNDVVYGVRSNRDTDSFFKRGTAHMYYKLLNLMGADVIYNHADYRLISARVVKELENYGEVNLFLRGLIRLVGFDSSCVYYERKVREAGKTHYPLSKMITLAFDGITSLTVRPIRIITVLGFVIAFFSFIGIIWAVTGALSGRTVDGWASSTCLICLVSGIQLVSLGVIGEYIGKIYLESKHRPKYIISERTWENSER